MSKLDYAHATGWVLLALLTVQSIRLFDAQMEIRKLETEMETYMHVTVWEKLDSTKKGQWCGK